MTKDNIFWRLAFWAVAAIFGAALFSVAVTDNRHNAHCKRVLRCLDTGVDRSHCDALYPGCETESAPDFPERKG